MPPQILQRKTNIESHFNILRATFSEIAARDIRKFLDAEEEKPDKEKLLELLGSSSKGKLEDKLRLFGVLALSAADQSSADLIEELEGALKQCYADKPAAVQEQLTAGLSGIKAIRQMQNLQQAPSMVCRESLIFLLRTSLDNDHYASCYFLSKYFA